MSIDEILKESDNELSGELDRDALLVARKINKRAFQDDMGISCRQFATLLAEHVSLSKVSISVNSGFDISISLDNRGIFYEKPADPLDTDIPPTISMKGDHYSLSLPLSFRGERHGMVTYEKDRFITSDVALLADVSKDLARHIHGLCKYRVAQEMSEEDDLTGLFNRRRFNTDYTHFIKGAKSSGKKISMIFGDIDHFKKINDTYGHPYGDYVLTSVGEIIRDNVRVGDLAYRYGGEEFVIILPGANEGEAEDVARRINDRIREKVFANGLPKEIADLRYHGRSDSRKVRMSIGVVSSEQEQDLLKAADEMMYVVKGCCRNAVFSRSNNDQYTGVAGLYSFLSFLENKIIHVNRSDKPSSLAVLVFDVVKFSDTIRQYGSDSSWNMFRQIAKWLYDQRKDFDYVARVCDRDNMVVMISGEEMQEEFRKRTEDLARRYLESLRKYECKDAGRCVKFDFAVGGGIYTPNGDIIEKPQPLFGFAEQMTADAGDLDSRLKIESYKSISEQ